MAYLVDGHNLIPKLPGLSLSAIDDEMQLVQMLQEFCHRRRKQVEVYFDNAPPGQDGVRSFGPVKAHFVRRGRTADSAIRARLQRLGRSAPNWTIVSSDASVQAAGRAVGAQILNSEAFASLMLHSSGATGEPAGREAPSLSPTELEDWLDLFGGEKDG